MKYIIQGSKNHLNSNDYLSGSSHRSHYITWTIGNGSKHCIYFEIIMLQSSSLLLSKQTTFSENKSVSVFFIFVLDLFQVD